MNVSRETGEALATFAELVKSWNPKINLVARSTLDDLQARHIADSCQIAELAPNATSWADLGSGGGFPGIVVAIMRPDLVVTLVEADQRKAVFLRHVVRTLKLEARVVNERIESLQPLASDVVSARALAPLPRLIPLAQRHGNSESTFIFLKGATYQQELDDAAKAWQFDVDVQPSKLDKDSVILLMRNFASV